ncbi:hypothetical protein [Holospora obtusa]|nr:hypothetical protein [Holospora obtusa]
MRCEKGCVIHDDNTVWKEAWYQILDHSSVEICHVDGDLKEIFE